ncbi:MAG: DUF3160 domain-containing protein [Candidatus Obscuribacterales bacterium]|nr:DUF3160 domain-containing protein [Candidatus Obscuribacterales bacterium]
MGIPSLKLSLLASLFVFCLPAFALDLDGIPYPLKVKSQKPIKVDRKNQSLEEVIDRVDIPYGYAQTIPLSGINISGLKSKAVQTLGENYFVVSSNSGLNRLSDVYRENRASGKANFVTVDSFLHPYLAFVNRIYAQLIAKDLLPMIKVLLSAMLDVAMSDYKLADDADVRSDVEVNIAFLSLGLKLVDSTYAVPQIGTVPAMVQKDFDALVEGKSGHSAIFDCDEDFRLYQPLGFYRTSPELIKFYRLKTWLSRLSYPISDVSFRAGGGSASNFRRSVLLYRTLDQAVVDGKPAFEYWTHLIKCLFVLGSQVESGADKSVYAHDYRSVFGAKGNDLKVTLAALSEPLTRTKLLLAVRRQKPVSLSAASVFDIGESSSARENSASFRFIPNIGSPEEPWLRTMALSYPSTSENGQICPLGLMNLNAWGATHAGNLLLDSGWALDSNLPKYILALRKAVTKRLLGGQALPVENRVWSLVSPQFRLLPDGIQNVVRTEAWASRRLETALSAWLDSLLTIAPENPISAGGKEIVAASANVEVSPRKLKAMRRAARGHFLDPCPEAFQKLQQDAGRIMSEAQALGLNIGPHKKGLEDYLRLFQRLEQIATQEIRGEAIKPADMNLLSNIDIVLERIDLPLPAVLSFPGEQTQGSGGVNLCLGNPGRLYVVLQNRTTKEWTLARGGVYTYYELPGAAISLNQLLHKIELGQARPPFWTERFDIVQSAAGK